MPRSRDIKPNGKPRKRLDGEPMPSGRESKFTPVRAAKILDLVRAGNFYVTAAGCVGISERCFAEWRQIGKRLISEGKTDEPLAQFVHDLTLADSDSEAEHVSNIREAGSGSKTSSVKQTRKPVLDASGQPELVIDKDGDPVRGPDGKVVYKEYVQTSVEETVEKDWRASLSHLAYRHRDRYGKKVEHTGSITHEVVLTDEERADAEKIVGRRFREFSEN